MKRLTRITTNLKERISTNFIRGHSCLFILCLFFCLTKPAIADTDFIQLADTTHTYEGGTGSLSIDGDFNTSQHQSSGGDYDSNAVATSTHTFSVPRTITLIKYRMSASAHVYGDEEQIADIHWNVQYYDGSWHVITGTEYNYSAGGNTTLNQDSGIIQLPINLSNVTKIKAIANGHTHSGGDSRTNESHAYVYEIQAFGVIDIGLRAYDGSNVIKIACEPTGILTSPLRISKNGTTYAVILVDTADTRASKIRIKTSSGIKALRKY